MGGGLTPPPYLPKKEMSGWKRKSHKKQANFIGTKKRHHFSGPSIDVDTEWVKHGSNNTNFEVPHQSWGNPDGTMNGQLINCTSESDGKQEQHTHNILRPLYPHWMATLEFLEPLSTGIPQIQAVTSIISCVRRVRRHRVSSASIVNSVWFMVSNWETSVMSTVNRKWGQLFITKVYGWKLGLWLRVGPSRWFIGVSRLAGASTSTFITMLTSAVASSSSTFGEVSVRNML